MNEDEKKTPDATPPKEVIKTPPRIPSLPGRQPESLQNDKPAGAKPFDFKAAVKNAMIAETGVESPLKPVHERGVSWDRNVANNEKIPASPPTPGYLTQVEDASGATSMPTLMARTAPKPGFPPRPPHISSRTTSGSSQTSSGYSRRHLNLDSIADDPFEREAEDVLLEALEERDPMHARSNIGENILSGVPVDEIKHDFSLDSESSAGGGHARRTSTASGASGTNAARPPMRPRLMSRDNQSKASRAPSERQVVQQQAHRRTLTVEEALFGLTAALSAVQHDERKEGLLPKASQHQRKDTSDSTSDRLAQTADLVFGRRFMRNRNSSISETAVSNANSEPSSPAPPTPKSSAGSAPKSSAGTTAEAEAPARPVPISAKSKWGLVKASLDVYKKTDIPEGDEGEDDEENLEGVDIETGDEHEHEHDARYHEGRRDSSDDEIGGDDGKKSTKRKSRLKKALSPFKHLPYADKIKNEWDLFNNFLHPRKASMLTYARYIFLYLWVPALGAASILFHLFENPPTGRGPWDDDALSYNETAVEAEPVDKLEQKASISWWIVFICIREVSLVVIAKCVEAIVVDFLAIQTRAILRTFGPVITLLLVQSKGWPFLISCWGVLNFLLVTGDKPFNKHWLYWQDVWGLFNENNPSGDVTNTLWLLRICAVCSALGVAVSLKRVAVGIYLGRQTFTNYSNQLARVMNQMLQISQVAILGQAIEKKYWAEMDKFEDSGYYPQKSTRGFSRDNLLSLIENANDEADEVSMMDMSRKSGDASPEDSGRIIDTNDIDPFTGSLGSAQKARIADLLGRWEEPGRGHLKTENVSVGAVLQFRRALASMNTPYPFSGSFGLADTRERCIASAQTVYERLLLKNNTVNGKLHFDVMAVLALQRDGELDPEKAKELIRTFRPDRDGGLSMVDFVRSIDSVYKDLRMLRATVAASSKIDKALESIMNIVFYVSVFCIILAAYDFDPLALFLSLSSIILAFAFMIGSASAKYFEGILLILVQRPYGIGDRINISDSESDSNGGGAQGWIVDDVTLFTTTIFLAGTNEKATVSNGTLAKSRIINGARSHKAILVLNLKFGLDSPFNRIEIFKSAVEKFVKARPREWLGLLAIRANRVEADLGFVEYSVVLQHREAWQNMGPILDSKHAVHSFMLELTKKLGLRYQQPALPVVVNTNLNGMIPTIESKFDFESRSKGKGGDEQPLSPKSTETNTSEEVNAVMAMFEGR